MTRRTIAEARAELDRLTLPPAKRREYEGFLTKRVKREVARVTTSQSMDYTRLDEQVSAVKTALSTVEDDLHQLEKDSRSREVSASEYREGFDRLQRRRRSLLDKASSLESQVERFASIEEDPEAQLDSLYTRFPTIRPEWPW